MARSFLLICLLFLLINCKKDLQVAPPDLCTFNSYKEMMGQEYIKTDGRLMISSNKSMGPEFSIKDNQSYTITALMRANNENLLLGDLHLNQLIYSPRAIDNAYSSEDDFYSAMELYGEMVKVDLRGQNNEVILLDSFRMPLNLFQEAPNMQQRNISPGQMVKWNADMNNVNGIVISIEYDPDFFGNGDFVSAGYNKKICNGKVVKDDGAYKLEADMFKNIPKGAMVTYNIGRGSSKITNTTNGKTFSMEGYTLVVGAFVYEN